ncbi:unnamed protein product [Linum tenue]|uniref:Uncharacterized protein n=2 Tax=Linum TaxID=4005 RepID=A0AAV0KP71_9ROSI|nr:unnamed protein product [Linum tenue]
MAALEDVAAVMLRVMLRKSMCMFEGIVYTLMQVASLLVSTMRYSTSRIAHPAAAAAGPVLASYSPISAAVAPVRH